MKPSACRMIQRLNAWQDRQFQRYWQRVREYHSVIDGDPETAYFRLGLIRGGLERSAPITSLDSCE